jgi:predicted GNAT family acetyltransferase
MTDVADNPERHRYELPTEGGIAFVDYAARDGALVFRHTEVPEALSGRGVGSRLVRGALEDARRRGLSVVPLCPFVRAYVDRHPEFRDLVAER